MTRQAFTICPAVASDPAIIARHRRAMFQAIGLKGIENLEAMEVKFRAWVVEKIIQ